MVQCKKPAVRFWVAVMIFFAVFITYAIRLHFNILIVAMVSPKSKKGKPPACDPGKNMSVEGKSYPGIQRDWDERIQGQLIGAYGYGFLFTNVVGGLLAELYGPYKVILWSNVVSGCLVSVTSFSAHIHWGVIILLRVLLGLMGGMLYPAVQSLLSNWAPPTEKGKFVALLMGNTIGSIVTLPAMGWIATAFNYDVGFVTTGVATLLYALCFAFIAADNPRNHRWISEEEREYILLSQQGTVSAKKPVAPFLKMIRNIPFIAACLGHFGNMWGLFFQMTMVPKFLAEVLGFDLKKAGAISALPYLARFVSGICFGFIGDFIRKKDIMTVNKTRKFFTLFSHIIPGVILGLILVTKCNYIAAVALLVFSLMSNGAVVLTVLQNPHDLAPNFAGSIYGCMQTFSAPPAFLIPIITGELTKEESGIKQWSWVFLISSCVYLSGGVIFILFGSGELQAFNEIPEKETEPETT